MSLGIFDERDVISELVSFPVGGSPSAVTLATAGVHGARIDGLIMRNSDSVDHQVTVTIHSGANDFTFMVWNVSAGIGTPGNAPQEILGFIALGQTAGILLKPLDEFTVAVDAVPLAAGEVVAFAFGGQL